MSDVIVHLSRGDAPTPLHLPPLGRRFLGVQALFCGFQACCVNLCQTVMSLLALRLLQGFHGFHSVAISLVCSEVSRWSLVGLTAIWGSVCDEIRFVVEAGGMLVCGSFCIVQVDLSCSHCQLRGLEERGRKPSSVEAHPLLII